MRSLHSLRIVVGRVRRPPHGIAGVHPALEAAGGIEYQRIEPAELLYDFGNHRGGD